MTSQMLNSVSFNLKIVPDKKNMLTIDKSRVLGDIKTIFINSKVTSAEITDHCGAKHRYSDGEFLDPVKLDTWPDKPLDLPSIYGWTGTIDLKTNQLGDLVSNLSPLKSEPALVINESYAYFWKFDDSSVNFRQVTSSRSELPYNLSNFAFGTIVNGDCFVSHFSTHSASQFSDLHVKLVPHKNELNLMFTVIDETGTKKKVILRYDCNSIKSVNIHHVQSLGFSFYAELSNAPKMFVADGQSCLPAGRKQIKWRRKSSCGPISRDLISKCNVLRLTWFSYGTSYIPALYRWRSHLKFDLSFGGIINYSDDFVDESTDIVFPGEIKYLLARIRSLSYNYQDDLQINNRGEKVINELIKKQIAAGKSDQVQRSLHHLYYAYVCGKVYYVFEHFKYLLNKVELEWADIKDIERGKDPIIVPQYMSRIGLSLSQFMVFVDLPEYTKIYITNGIYGGSHPYSEIIVQNEAESSANSSANTTLIANSLHFPTPQKLVMKFLLPSNSCIENTSFICFGSHKFI